MNFFKNIFSKILKPAEKKEINVQQHPLPPDEKSSGEINREEKKDLKKKSDEELIAELNELAPGIFSQAKTPEMKKLIIDVFRKMIEDGVDVKNEKEVEEWMKKNSDLFRGNNMPEIKTYRREKPKIGRNDPCPCGSGKKYKKCCGKNESK